MNRFEKYYQTLEEPYRTQNLRRIAAWGKTTLTRAIRLADQLEAAGLADPESWVFSEIEEDIAQAARWALLHTLWKEAVLPLLVIDFGLQSDPVQGPILDRINGVLSPEEKRSMYLEIARTMGFHLLYALDSGVLNDDLPGWSVQEMTADDELTGRDVGGLHESVFEVWIEPRQ